MNTNFLSSPKIRHFELHITRLQLNELVRAEKEELFERTLELEEELEEVGNPLFCNPIVQVRADSEVQERKKAEVEEELKRNEDLLEVMEKKFDEQHAKVMVSAGWG